jgi:hypothetical protein
MSNVPDRSSVEKYAAKSGASMLGIYFDNNATTPMLPDIVAAMHNGIVAVLIFC